MTTTGVDVREIKVAAPQRAASTLARRSTLLAHLFTVAIIAIWAVVAYRSPPYLLPGPVLVLENIASFFTNPRMFRHLVASLSHVSYAVAISIVLGTIIAAAGHFLRLTRFFIESQFTPFFNSFSAIGWIMLAIVWFGLNSFTIVFAITAVLLPFAILNMKAGFESTDGELLEMARSFGRGKWKRFLLIQLPSLMPFLFATLRINFGISWKVALTAELFGGNSGLGYLLNLSRQNLDTPRIMAIIFLIIAVIYLSERLVFAPLQRKVSRHYVQQ